MNKLLFALLMITDVYAGHLPKYESYSSLNKGLLQACKKLSLPYYIRRGNIHIDQVGISLGPIDEISGTRKKAKSLIGERTFRKALFYEFFNRHSAPAKGIDELDDNEIFEKMNVFIKPLNNQKKSFELLKQYAMTDYGAQMIAKIMSDSDHAVKAGFLLRDGTVTEEGKSAIVAGDWEGHFLIGKASGQPQAGRNSVSLPNNLYFDRPFQKFPVGEEIIDFLAIVHHEFGHTRFSKVPVEEKEHIYLEADVVNDYENPVRYINTHYYRLGNFAPRINYYDGVNTINTKTYEVYEGPVYIAPNDHRHHKPLKYKTEVGQYGEIYVKRSPEGFREYEFDADATKVMQ